MNTALNEAISFANSIPPGSPPYELAVALCFTLGRNPYAWESTPYGGSLENWRAVLVEEVLRARLEEVLTRK